MWLPVGIAVIAFVWWRAGSTSVLLERFWRLITGKSDVGDPVLSGYIQEMKDLEKFRFIYRVKVDSLAELHKLISWMKLHSIHLRTVKAAGKWIDIKSDEILTVPSNRYFSTRIALILLSYISAYAIGYCAISSSALLQTRETKSWFLANSKEIRTLSFWNENKATTKECTESFSQVSSEFGFSSDETKMICQSLKDQNEKFVTLVHDSLLTQRITLALFATPFLILFILTTVRVKVAATAKEISKLIKNKEEKNLSAS
jgi:hypothetical protein